MNLAVKSTNLRQIAASVTNSRRQGRLKGTSKSVYFTDSLRGGHSLELAECFQQPLFFLVQVYLIFHDTRSNHCA